jgi:hypothetical protein
MTIIRNAKFRILPPQPRSQVSAALLEYCTSSSLHRVERQAVSIARSKLGYEIAGVVGLQVYGPTARATIGRLGGRSCTTMQMRLPRSTSA